VRYILAANQEDSRVFHPADAGDVPPKRRFFQDAHDVIIAQKTTFFKFPSCLLCATEQLLMCVQGTWMSRKGKREFAKVELGTSELPGDQARSAGRKLWRC
jgi:hypothetical protein